MFVKKILNKKIRFVRKTFIWSLVLALIMTVAVTANEQKSIALSLTENKDVTDVNVVGEQAVMSEDGRLPFIAFEKDSSIKAALRVLAALYNKNIVPSSKVDGLLGFTKLRDVTFEEAMNAILGADFTYEQDGNLIKVYTKEEYKEIMEAEERMITRVFILYYIRAAEAKRLVEPVLSSAGSVQTSSPAETIVPTSESISAGSSGGDSMALNDTIVIRDYPEKIDEAEQLLNQLDVRPRQVLVEATILGALLDEDTRLGIDWSTIGGVAISSVSGVAALGRGGEEMTGFAMPNLGGLRVGVTADKVTALITALENVTDVTVMANPKILAINKQLGQVYIGRKIGYREGDTFDAQGNRVEGAVKFLETGTKLSFRPYIGNDGYIRMDIQPKDSDGDLDQGVPYENSTELATNIMVKNGETVVIGGLFRDWVGTTRNQVPLLGNLPILGTMFRGTSDLTQREEVIVMLTPHIIDEPSETNGDKAAADVARKRSGAKASLQAIGRRRLAEDCYADAARYYIEGDNESAMRKLRIALTLRPTYLEAIRLKEKVLAETDPDEAEMLERIILEDIDRQEAPNW